VLDELQRDAERVLTMRALITRQRAQDAPCATIQRVGSIRDFEAVLVVLRAL
jgi:hypothetical protein